jgi:hypothetical protein
MRGTGQKQLRWWIDRQNPTKSVGFGTESRRVHFQSIAFPTAIQIGLRSRQRPRISKKPDSKGVRLRKGSAATYSRASYTCTTIGNAVFDGRVRDGIGSGHRFMATVKCFREQDSLKTAYVGA